MESFEATAEHAEPQSSRLRFSLHEVAVVALIVALLTGVGVFVYLDTTDRPTACEAYTALAMPLAQPSGQNSVPAINPILLADVATPTAEYTGRDGALRRLFDKCVASVKDQR